VTRITILHLGKAATFFAICAITDTLHSAEPASGGSFLDLPAVSSINGKLAYSGGSMESFESHNVDGSVSIPVGERFGFQADGLYSNIDGDDFYGGAGHVFWRKPDLGLIGITGGYLFREGVETYHAGAEVEYYWKRLTLRGFAGIGALTYEFPVPFIDSDPMRFAGTLGASYYLLEDLRAGVSYSTVLHNHLGKAEVEYQTPVSGLTLTGEFALGEHDYDHWLVGVRWYFGEKKSLRARHRTDDPPSLMPQILQGLGVYGADFNKRARHYLRQDHLPGSGTVYGSSFSFGVESQMYIGWPSGINSGVADFDPTLDATP